MWILLILIMPVSLSHPKISLMLYACASSCLGSPSNIHRHPLLLYMRTTSVQYAVRVVMLPSITWILNCNLSSIYELLHHTRSKVNNNNTLHIIQLNKCVHTDRLMYPVEALIFSSSYLKLQRQAGVLIYIITIIIIIILIITYCFSAGTRHDKVKGLALAAYVVYHE